MDTVKVGQIWRDKDKRRDTRIEIIDFRTGEDFEPIVVGLVVGTEEERDYKLDRLTKRWRMEREAPKILIPVGMRAQIDKVLDMEYPKKTVVRPRQSGKRTKVTMPAVQPVSEKTTATLVGGRRISAPKNWQLKAVCAVQDEGQIVRITQKQADTYGMPLCGCHSEPMRLVEYHPTKN